MGKIKGWTKTFEGWINDNNSDEVKIEKSGRFYFVSVMSEGDVIENWQTRFKGRAHYIAMNYMRTGEK